MLSLFYKLMLFIFLMNYSRLLLVNKYFVSKQIAAQLFNAFSVYSMNPPFKFNRTTASFYLKNVPGLLSENDETLFFEFKKELN